MLNQSRILEELDTPAVVVDLDVLDANLRRTAQLASQSGVKLRPHTKTHKSVWLAQQQIRYGAAGITVAKLGEAEVMAEAGIDDILVAYPIVGKVKLERLGKLLNIVRVITTVDHYDVARGVSDLGESLGRKIPLYVDINSGLNRCGKEPGDDSADLVTLIAALSGVEVVGLMTHAGHVYGKASEDECRSIAHYEAECLLRTQKLLRKRGVDVREISVGSTPTSKFINELIGVTEMRPGAYVYGDVSQIGTGSIGLEECALRVYARVISIPRPGTVIVDAGSKTLTSDLNSHRKGYGLLPGHPEIVVERLSEEHGILQVPTDTAFQIGDVVEIIPNHCCTVANLHNQLLGVRDGRFERFITVDARGKIN